MRILIKFYLPAICFGAFRLIIILSLFLALSIDQKRFLGYRDNAGNDVVSNNQYIHEMVAIFYNHSLFV
ncbi:hypothetical protein C6H66_19385 [Photorhabdus hindustanensis]|uniref:Uncharacterized protein n=1 Tax=Photorhabdus hindustanensis TaxID=2918802 RepID=A0A2S8PWP1_9GAMM|nr:hypothetical protein C6H66_19385 [Photorhabdus hindustanensis]